MRRTMILSCACLLTALTSVALAADPQTKTGTIKSVDATAKSFVLDRQPRELTFKTDDKTTFTLDGKASTFADALKKDLAATVTYTTVDKERTASKVETTTAAATTPAPAK